MELLKKGVGLEALMHSDNISAYIQPSQLRSREAIAMLLHADDYTVARGGVAYRTGQIPLGSVEFVEAILNAHYLDIDTTPEFYPEFAPKGRKMTRDFNEAKTWPALFVKRVDGFKQFPTKTYTRYEYHVIPDIYTHDCIYSEVITPRHEWRYYIHKGLILDAGWYDGRGEMCDAPAIDFEIPQDYSGALDMCLTTAGEFLLVESQLSYACGWYGETHRNYTTWLTEGFRELIN